MAGAEKSEEGLGMFVGEDLQCTALFFGRGGMIPTHSMPCLSNLSLTRSLPRAPRAQRGILLSKYGTSASDTRAKGGEAVTYFPSLEMTNR